MSGSPSEGDGVTVSVRRTRKLTAQNQVGVAPHRTSLPGTCIAREYAVEIARLQMPDHEGIQMNLGGDCTGCHASSAVGRSLAAAHTQNDVFTPLIVNERWHRGVRHMSKRAFPRRHDDGTRTQRMLNMDSFDRADSRRRGVDALRVLIDELSRARALENSDFEFSANFCHDAKDKNDLLTFKRFRVITVR